MMNNLLHHSVNVNHIYLVRLYFCDNPVEIEPICKDFHVV